jgi:hypothetical protein
MAGPNFELITELQTLTRRDFTIADSTILAPTGALPLVDGEWLEINSSYQLARGATGVQSYSPLTFPVHTERGRYDTQAIGKVNVLMLGMYEAETQVMVASGITLGEGLIVNSLASGAHLGRRGLVEQGSATATTLVVGYATKLPASNGGKLRFVHFGNALV